MSAFFTKGYNSAAVTVVFNGALLDGFGPDSRVEITYPEQFTKVIGADGEVARSKTNDQTCQVKLTLLQTSASNDILSATHTLDATSPFGGGVGNLLIKDLLGTTLVACAQAWIMKYADVAFAKEVGTREWTIDCGTTATLIGGNFPAA